MRIKRPPLPLGHPGEIKDRGFHLGLLHLYAHVLTLSLLLNPLALMLLEETLAPSSNFMHP